MKYSRPGMPEKVVETYTVDPLVTTAYRLPHGRGLQTQPRRAFRGSVRVQIDQSYPAWGSSLQKWLELPGDQDRSVSSCGKQVQHALWVFREFDEELFFRDPEELRENPPRRPAVDAEIESISRRTNIFDCVDISMPRIRTKQNGCRGEWHF
jgi:hypothetical protein